MSLQAVLMVWNGGRIFNTEGIPRGDGRQIFLIAVLAVLAFATPTVALVSSHAISALVAMAAVGAIIVSRWARLEKKPLNLSIAVPVVAILAWAAVSLLWTLNAGTASLGLCRTVGAMAAGMVIFSVMQQLDDRQSRTVLRALALGVAVAAVVIGSVCGLSRLMMSWGGNGVPSIYKWAVGMDRACTMMAILVWPAAFFLWSAGRRAMAALLFAAVVMAALVGYALAAKVALLAGGVILLASTIFTRRAVIAAVVGLMFVSVIAAPVVAANLPSAQQALRWNLLPLSAVHRLAIWHFAAEKIAESPVFGYGYDSSREIGQNRVVQLNSTLAGEVMPLHPHNFALQIWLELGGIGAVLIAIPFVSLLRKLSREERLMETVGLTATFLVAMVSYGIWQNWWLCMLWVIASVYSLIRNPLATVSTPQSAMYGHVA